MATSWTYESKSAFSEYLLLEDGSYILLEDGGKIILEQTQTGFTPTWTSQSKNTSTWSYQTKN